LPAKVRDAERRCPHERDVPGPRLVHMPSEPSGSQRSPTVSSGTRFAQATGAILGKQARSRALIRMRSPASRASPVTPFQGRVREPPLDVRHRICYGARGQDGFRDATREEERRRAPHRGEVVPIGSLCEQRRTCWGSERLHFAPGPQPFLTSRAIRVPHPRVNPGTQRTTTVTSTSPTSWSSSPDQQERILRMCLIRMRALVQVQPGPLHRD
jgi:hypothetical protein